MLSGLLSWLADNAVALGALAVAAWAHVRVARTDRVNLRVEHELEPVVDGWDGKPVGLAHYVRVTNRGRHPTEIDRLWIDAPSLDGGHERREVELRRSEPRSVPPGGTWRHRLPDALVRELEPELGAVDIIIRDVVTDTEWQGQYRTRVDTQVASRNRASAE